MSWLWKVPAAFTVGCAIGFVLDWLLEVRLSWG